MIWWKKRQNKWTLAALYHCITCVAPILTLSFIELVCLWRSWWNTRCDDHDDAIMVNKQPYEDLGSGSPPCLLWFYWWLWTTLSLQQFNIHLRDDILFLYTCMIYKASCIQLFVNWRFLKVKGAYKYPNWMSHHVFLENFQTGVGLFSIPKIKLQFFIFLAKRLQYKTKFIFIADFFLTNCLRSVFLGMDLKGISYSYSPLPVSLTRSKKWRRQGCLLPALHQALVNHSEKLFAPSCQ